VLLGVASRAKVDPSQLFWEPSRGVVLDFVAGRGVFFVARPAAAALRDVFHARVRVSPSGQPLSVTCWRNLTQTPAQDDTGLQGKGRYGAFATLSQGLVRSATVLDGNDHSAVLLDRPTASLTMTLSGEQLQLITAEADEWQLDLATRALRPHQRRKPADEPPPQWRPSEGQQPDPAGAASILESVIKLGTLQVRLISFDSAQLRWRLRAGEREPKVAGQRPAKYQLDAAEHARALFALNLGHATVGTDFGMAFQGTSSLPLRGDRATLLVPEQGTVRLIGPGASLELQGSDAAVQLPLLLDQGVITPQAASRGSRMLRAGLCVSSNERVLLALASNDSSDVLALALQKQGCRDAVELDRGSHHGAFLHRLGTTEAPLAAYQTSVLFGLSQRSLGD
jgi:hypothetical protein